MTEAELLLDLQEIEKLEELTHRNRIQQLLSAEKQKIQIEIQALQKTKQNEVLNKTPPKPKIPTVKITSYAWDQSEKIIKIYISNLNGVHGIDGSNITITSENHQHCLSVHNLNGKNYIFNVPKLLHEVGNVTFKVKTDMILIMLKKAEAKKWNYLTENEKISKSAQEKVPPMDKTDDPSASVMNMMKKMYEDGDDEMKRTIAKAWTESRDKMQVP